ncbi:hypothetical protein Tco_0623476, partial [Tanacetum coccineum]
MAGILAEILNLLDKGSLSRPSLSELFATPLCLSLFERDEQSELVHYLQPQCLEVSPIEFQL